MVGLFCGGFFPYQFILFFISGLYNYDAVFLFFVLFLIMSYTKDMKSDFGRRMLFFISKSCNHLDECIAKLFTLLQIKNKQT